MKKILFITLLVLGYNLVYAQSYNEILGRPTDNSITVSVMFNQNSDVYIEYGTSSGNYQNTTSQITSLSGTPDEIEITNLNPNTKYFYRTRYRLTGSGSFNSSPEHTFYTQRAVGSTFTFTMEADVHLYDKKGCANLYQVCLNNQADDKPDFMLDLGDTFGDDHHPSDMTSEFSDSLHKAYRPFLGSICHSIPFYFCLGNHEGEFDYYLAQTPPNNIAAWGTKWRKFYYPNPYPNNFYSGNTDVEANGIGSPENYYSWSWGDALFVVLDVYRYQNDTSAKPAKWNWTIGDTQYAWLKSTLENSTDKYKFVIAHHVSGQGRGGILQAKLFEWGGYEQNGTTFSFPTKRPNMEKPIHQLFVDNGVNIFFQGHDHVFAHEVMDGVIYQALPMPSDSTYEIGMLANADAYVSDTVDGSGHLRISVSPECAVVDYVKAFLPADTLNGVHHNKEVAFSYTLGTCATTNINLSKNKEEIKVFPNPATNYLSIKIPNNIEIPHIKLSSILGDIVLETTSNNIDISKIQNGVYLLNIKTSNIEENKKVIINH
ncbi:MAG: metallophosphoesterase [Bacteroidota bacterium]